MSNVIQIKRGKGKPDDGILAPYELGYATNDGQLYIGGMPSGEEGKATVQGIKVERAGMAETAKALTSTLSIDEGGTGATTATDARTNLGLGAVAIESTVPVTKGGTGATTTTDARRNLELGVVATLNTVPIDNGGTGATTAVNARNNLEIPKLFLSYIQQGTDIAENSDLNTLDFIKPGGYYCSNNARASTLKNSPTSLAFMMQVYSTLDNKTGNESTDKYVYRLRKITTHYGDEYTQLVYTGETPSAFIYEPWRATLKSSNYSDYALPLSGGQISDKLTLAKDKFLSNNTSGLDCNNSDITNINGIFFKDAVDGADEGINFYRGTNVWDTLYAVDGELKFHPNRTTAANVDGYKIYHSGNALTYLGEATITLNSTADFDTQGYRQFIIYGKHVGLTTSLGCQTYGIVTFPYSTNAYIYGFYLSGANLYYQTKCNGTTLSITLRGGSTETFYVYGVI